MLEDGRHISQRERDHLIPQYDAELVYLDEQLRLLEDSLRSRRLYDETLTILTSDHGEFFGEHDLVGHEKNLYEGVLAIPLIVKFPGSERTGIVDDLVENRALFYDMLEWVGLPQRKPDHDWEALAELYPRHPILLPDGTPIPLLLNARRAVYFDGLKYINSTDGKNEIYNLRSDAKELTNSLSQLPTEVNSGRKLSAEFLRRIPKWIRRDAVESLSEEEMRRLRALAYAE